MSEWNVLLTDRKFHLYLALLNLVIINSFSLLQTQNLDLINFIMHISVEKLYFIF